MTGNDVLRPEVIGSDSEGTSFDRKSPGRGCRRPISQVLGTFELLHGCISQEVAVRDRKLHHLPGSEPEVTLFDPKSPGSGCRRPICQILGTFELLQGCNSQEVAVM